VLRRSVSIALLLPAAALLAFAASADRTWFLRHVVVPAYYLPPPAWTLFGLRVACVALALALCGCALLASRHATASGAARVGVSVALSFCAAEMVLRLADRPEIETPNPRLEWRLGTKDPLTGWAYVPGRSVEVRTYGSGQLVRYDIDARGNRAPSTDFVEDTSAPTLIVAGESIATGHSLPWSDTFAARLGKMLGLQVVNVAEGGYASDQALLRVREALRRLARPVALVETVVPVQLHRNVQDDRPHLVLRGGDLVLEPASVSWLRLREIFVNQLPYLSEARLSRGLELTRAILRETAREAQARGARPVFVVPSFDASRPEAFAMEAVLEGLPHVVVDLDRSRLLPDGHPDPRGAQQIADAAAAALR